MSEPGETRRCLTILLFAIACVLMSACDPGKLRETMLPYIDARFSAAAHSIPSAGADGGKIAFVSDRDGNEEIYIMAADGANAINLTNHPASDRHPSWSPDGRALAFASTRADGIFDIYLLEIESGKLTRLTDQGSNTRPAWAPDGRRIAFVSDRFGDKDVMVMNAEGRRQIQLTVDVYADDQPTWSADGDSIAYVSDSDGQRNIYVMDSIKGTEILSLTADAAENMEPNWSKAERQNRLLFTSTRSGNQDIFLLDPVAGQGLRQITSDLSDEWQPAWSPDGAAILFVSDRENDGEHNIYAMTADGRTARRLTPLGSNDQEPNWK